MTSQDKFKKSSRLREEQFAEFGAELDALRAEIVAKLGKKDADYIRNIMQKKRWAEISGRALIHFSVTPMTWATGVALLSLAKILDNMEIGHNIMHGQYDWTNDPELQGNDFEWDIACEGDSWRRTHNYEHHTFTNIVGKDRDLGYDLLRMTDDTLWKPSDLFQLVKFFMLSTLFQWGVALHELDIGAIRRGERKWKDVKPFLQAFVGKAGGQLFKDYVFFPVLAGPGFVKVAAGNMIANGVRNFWTSAIIFCGHFPEDVQTFAEQECENETRGQWYYRQILGSANIEGGPLFHILSGNLSHQIEHHLFPDVPARRYAEMAPTVKRICTKYGVNYNSGSFVKQYGSTIKRIARYSLPDGVIPERNEKSDMRANTAHSERITGKLAAQAA